jgi:23S rRNA (adenine2030-N6)-methyltransferase
MNYRHVFHAGNFADLLKHAVLSVLLVEMTRAGGPLTVIDTHAGAGIYDLAGEAARKTGEAAAVEALMADAGAPEVFASLKAAVRGRQYPGSPQLIAAALRPGDRLFACETRADDFATLAAHLKRWPGATALNQDGWEAAATRTPAGPGPALVLIDPPYELADDGERAAATTRRVLARNGAAVIAVWAPIKDLATFDSLFDGLEGAAGARPVLVAEVRLRRLDDPTRLNGCAMMVVNAPRRAAGLSAVAAEWIAEALGEFGALGRARFVGS